MASYIQDSNILFLDFIYLYIYYPWVKMSLGVHELGRIRRKHCISEAVASGGSELWIDPWSSTRAANTSNH